MANSRGYNDAINVVLEAGEATTALLQKKLKMDYTSAANLMDELEQDGIIGPQIGSFPREVLASPQEWEVAKNNVAKKAARAAMLRSVFPTSAIVLMSVVVVLFVVAYIKMFPTVPDVEKGRFFALLPLGLVVGPAGALAVYHSVGFLRRWSVEAKIRKRRRLGAINFDALGGTGFEVYCSQVLAANGFVDVKTVGQSGDFGVDVLASKGGVRYAVQCKCYSKPIGNYAVQQAFAGMIHHGASVSAVMTNQYFTSQAKETAGELGVLLWDRDTVIDMARG